ncbi:MAG: VanZ family protein [Halioglobus sp.]|nr:VanZ family protein [Halioglobus sp.]
MHTIVFFVYAGIVAAMSLSPGSGQGVGHLDKVVHLLTYYIFAVFGYRMLANKQYCLFVYLGIIAYGGLIELGQSYVPGRHMSKFDVLANIAGVVRGALVMRRKG